MKLEEKMHAKVEERNQIQAKSQVRVLAIVTSCMIDEVSTKIVTRKIF